MKRQWIMMSVSALMICCLFVFMPGTVFADAADSSALYVNKMFYLSPSGASSTDNSDLYASLLCTGFYAYDEHLNPASYTVSNNRYTLYGFATGYVKCMYKLIIRNTTSNDLIIPATNIRMTVTPVTTVSTMELVDIDWNAGQLMVDRVNGSGNLYFSNAPDNSLFSYIVVPHGGDISCVFECTYHYNASSSQAGTTGISIEVTAFNASWVYPSIPVTPVVVAAGDAVFTSYDSYLPYIYYATTGIWESLKDQQTQGEGTSGDAEDTQEQIETIHGTEQTWYQGTETALEGTGLSTFTFGVHEAGAFGAMADFTAVWNSMGSFTIVPVFALSLKVATTVIRHMPRRKRMSEKDD